MENRCPSCGAIWKDGQTVCPYCGTKARLPAAADAAPVPVENGAVPVDGEGRIRKPKTLEELQQFCARQQLPLDKMRFCIGYDSNTPRMFGICRTPEGEFLVYKNKADGTRAVRYQGPDEAFAVNEIYEKLKSETLQRRGPAPGENFSSRPVYRSGAWGTQPARTNGGGARQSGKRRLSPTALILIAVIVISMITRGNSDSNRRTVSRLTPRQGYYSYSGDDYYYYGDDWYLWDSVGGWVLAGAVDDLLTDNYDDYYTSYAYNDGGAYSDFSESGWYNGDYEYDYDDSYDSDYDSGYDDDDDWDWDWSSDSDWDDWDSGDTDWDSDW